MEGAGAEGKPRGQKIDPSKHGINKTDTILTLEDNQKKEKGSNPTSQCVAFPEIPAPFFFPVRARL